MWAYHPFDKPNPVISTDLADAHGDDKADARRGAQGADLTARHALDQRDGRPAGPDHHQRHRGYCGAGAAEHLPRVQPGFSSYAQTLTLPFSIALTSALNLTLTLPLRQTLTLIVIGFSLVEITLLRGPASRRYAAFSHETSC